MKLPASRFPRVAQRLVLPALLLAGASAQADLNFTFTGINVNVGGSAGYIQGQPYTFTFVINGDFAVGTGSDFASDYNFWRQSAPTDDILFNSFSGSGIGGSVTGTPQSVVYVGDNGSAPGVDFLGLEFLPSGITANGFSITSATLQVANSGNLTNVFPGSYVAPQSVFSAINGVEGSFDLITSDSGASFNLTSFEIQNTATEVPFGVDSTAGLAVLGLAGAWKLRRRRKLAAVNAAN